MAVRPPPALPVELVEQILLRLPPDELACLLRASLVCKSWGSAVSCPGFRRGLQKLHRAPPLLGFLHNREDERVPRFIPTTESPFSLAAPDCASWEALDCRHGRALFLSQGQDTQELLVWEPITGRQHRVPLLPEAGAIAFAGAVVCAADGCDHSDCHGRPFRVVVAFDSSRISRRNQYRLACVYSSETGTWAEPTWLQVDLDMDFAYCCSVLVGRSLLYFMASDSILKYDLVSQDMALFDDVLDDMDGSYIGKTESLSLVLAEDGGMRVCQKLRQHLKFWKREPSDDPDSDIKWVQTRVIDLRNLLQIGAVLNQGTRVVGFAEGPNVIFLDTVAGIFTVDLQSEKERKVCDKRVFCDLIPVVSFYTHVHQGEHQDPPSSGLSEEAGREDGGEKEKVVEQPQLLFGKGSNVIEEGDALKTRIPLDDVPKSASNGVSVTGTTGKDDAGNSKISGSNVEDVAISSQKVLRR